MIPASFLTNIDLYNGKTAPSSSFFLVSTIKREDSTYSTKYLLKILILAYFHGTIFMS